MSRTPVAASRESAADIRAKDCATLTKCRSSLSVIHTWCEVSGLDRSLQTLRLTALLLPLFSFLIAHTQAQTPGTSYWNPPRAIQGSASSPALGLNGRLYVGTSAGGNGQVFAIEAESSTIRWKKDLKGDVLGSPLIGANGTIYIGTSGDPDASFIGLRDTGDNVEEVLRLTIRNASITTTPAAGIDGTIYFVASTNLYAVDPTPPGRLKWTLGLHDYFNPASAVAIGPDGTIYAGNWNTKLYDGVRGTNFFAVRDLGDSGTIKWGLALDDRVGSSPSIGKDGTIYITSERSLYAITDLGATGRFKWTSPFTPGGLIQSSPSISTNGTLYFGARSSQEGLLFAVVDEGSNFRPKWTNPFRVAGDVSSSPAIAADGTLHFGTQYNFLYSIRDAGASAALNWDPPFQGQVTGGSGLGMARSSPIIATLTNSLGTFHTVIIGSDDGNLYSVYSATGLGTNAPWPMYRQNPQHTGRVPNQAPTITTPITSYTTPEDVALDQIQFTIGDFETPVAALQMSATSSNPTLVPNSSAGLEFTGSGSNRFLKIIPALDQNGSATITVSVTDALGLSASVNLSLTVFAINDAPRITGLSDETTREDEPILVEFTVDDPETPTQLLSVAASSSNPTLVPNPIVVEAPQPGQPRLRTILLRPTRDQVGVTTITVSAADFNLPLPLTNRVTFNLTVVPVSDAPFISPIADRAGNEDTIVVVPFTLSDVDTPLDTLELTAISLEPGLVPNSAQGLQLGGAGANRSLTITPALNQHGIARIRLLVEDESTNTFLREFAVTFQPVNDPPTISDVGNLQTLEGQRVDANFFVSDVESTTDSLQVTASSSNSSLLPSGNIFLAGGGSIRLVSLIPTAGQQGNVDVTLTVSDGQATDSTTFTLRVGSTNDAPTIVLGDIPQIPEDTTITSGTAVGIPFTIADRETAPNDLVVTATSADPTLVPNSPNNLILGGFGPNRSLFVIPSPNQSGLARLTIRVSDGVGSTTTNFNFRITPINDAPTATPLTAETDEGRPIDILLAGLDIDNPSNELAYITFQAKNPPATLATNNAPRITYQPRPGFAGVDQFYYQVLDPTGVAGDRVNGASPITRVTVTVRGVNDPPVLSEIPDQIVQQNTRLTLPFTVIDPDSTTLSLSSRSSSELVIPVTNIFFSGTGTNRILTLTPAPNRAGESTITITATDPGGLTDTEEFKVRVNAVPVIGPIADQKTTNGIPTPLITFFVSDADHAPTDVVVTASADDTQLVPEGAIFLSIGSGLERLMIISPAPNHTGSTRIHLTAVDPNGGATTNSFLLTVYPRLDPPTIVTQPLDREVNAGVNVSFVVVAGGSDPRSYQWFFNSNPIPGAISTFLTLTNVQPAQAGGYYVTVTNAVGTATSRTATLKVITPLNIVSHPASLTRVLGTSAAFSVIATGAPPIFYQWKFGTNSIPGATNSTIEIPAVQVANAGVYSVIVSNATSSLTSSGAFLFVLVPPSITQQPTNQTVVSGATAFFNVTAEGSGPLTYQWALRGTPLTGATNQTLIVANASPAQEGAYTVTVTGPGGFVTSQPATLTVLTPPVITQQPQALAVNAGSPATFQVTATGSAPLAYQWRFNQNPIPNATNRLYTIAQTQLANQGDYSVVITNLAGTVTSAAATLTVTNSSSSPVFTTDLADVSVEVGATATLSVTATGNPTPSFLWLFQTTNLVQSGSSPQLIITNIQPDQAGPYHVIATNTAGSATSRVAQVTVTFPNIPPTVSITRPLANTTFASPATINIDANAADEDGRVTRVEFLLDGSKVGEDAAAPFNFAIPGLGVGDYTLTARAIDNVDAATLSAPVPISVRVQSNLPALSIFPDLIPDAGLEGTAPPDPALKAFQFKVVLSRPSTTTVDVEYATADGTAVAPSDYMATNGTLHFLAGETNRTLTVHIQSDAEPDSSFESFFVNLSNPVNATLADDQEEAVIVDDEIPIFITITDRSIREGNSGRTSMTFDVFLTAQSSQEVRVEYATVNLSALANLDYVASAGTLLFPPGTTNRSLTVPVLGDTLIEPNEMFAVVLTNAINASLAPASEGGLADPEAIGLIQDDDAPVPVDIAIESVVEIGEGDTGERPATFRVTLSNPTRLDVQVAYATENATALAGKDYIATAGTLRFSPGSTEQIINVPIRGNSLDEPDREFLVRLSAPVGGSITQPLATGRILDDDVSPRLSVTAAAPRAEGNAGLANVSFIVRLSTASAQTVIVDFTTEDGSARSGEDYIANNGSIEFAPGLITTNVVVQIRGDLLPEPNENFFLVLSNSRNAIIATQTAPGTIINDDVAPSLSISGASVIEGQAGTTNAVFAVRLSAAAALPVTVEFTTVAESAAAPADFEARSGILTFTPGTVLQSITVPVLGDTLFESDESFLVQLANATNATLQAATAQAQGLILNDDSAAQPPAIVDQPDSLETIAGRTASFTVVASGSAPLDYQWRFRGNPLPGATTATLTIPAAAPSHEGPYDVIVSNNAGAVTSQVATLTVLVPPSFIVQPGPRTLPAGSSTTFFAVAAGTQPLAFQWSRNGTTLPLATNTTLTLTDVQPADQGDYTVTVTNRAGTIVSTPARLTVLVPTNQPPVVRINSPANGTAFTPPATVPVTAIATDADGTVTRVDFFLGTTLLNSDTTAPYEVAWTNTAVGSYSLTARAYDDKGDSTLSAPVNVLFTRRPAAAAVAIIRNAPAAEINEIQDYLLELGLSSVVFDQDGLTYEQLTDFRLVIWDDTGANGITANDVNILARLRQADYPLYFIGERLASSATTLAEPQAATWRQLTRLNPTATLGASLVTISSTTHPVINGHFGTVANLNYPRPIEGASLTPADTTLLGTAGTASAIAAYESPDTPYRSVSQNVLASVGADPSTVIEQKKLFKNAIVWLLRTLFPALTDLSATAAGPTAPFPAGQETTVTWRIRQRGEVEASGVNLVIPLPPEIQFVRADFTRGSVKLVNGVLTYTLGNMENGELVEFTTVFNPVAAGTYTLHGTVSGNEADPNLANNSAAVTLLVEASAQSDAARLAVVDYSGSVFRGHLVGSPGRRYRIEYSLNLTNWTALTELTATAAPTPFTDPNATTPHRSYRALLLP